MIGSVVVVFMAIFSVSEARTATTINLKQVAMPANCVGKNYCFEKSKDYPSEIIDKAIDKLNGQLIEGGNEIGDRGGLEKPEDDCERQINFEPIYEIVAADDTVRYVVQSDSRFLQIIRTESCVKPGRIDVSKFFEEYQLKRWNLTCKEKTIEYWFLVLSLDGERLENVQIKGKLPVCCSCRLESDYKQK